MTTTQTKIPERGTAEIHALSSIRDWLKAGATLKAADPKGDVLRIDGDTIYGGITVNFPGGFSAQPAILTPVPPPQPVIKPWTRETCPIGLAVRHKGNRNLYLIVECDDRRVYLGVGATRGYAELLEVFEQLDGTCCGTLEAQP